MQHFTVNSVGKIHIDKGDAQIVLQKEFIPTIKNLQGFSHIQILWWATQCDGPADRQNIMETAPYKNAPQEIGVFATRSPARPNPIALTCAQITYIDENNGIIGLAYVDAFEGTPVLDIKPYTPSADRVEHPSTPGWCAHWPANCETSGDFDWQSEFNF